MKGSQRYTTTINERKDVKRRRLYESSFDRKVSNFKLLIQNEPFLFALYVLVVYTGHQLFVSILKNIVLMKIQFSW